MGKNRPAIRGIIFDLDGLMVDNESLALEAWQRCLAPHGAHLTEEQYGRLVGMSHDDTARYASQHTGVAREVVDAGYWEHLLALIGEHGKPMDGLVPLLEELAARGYVLGVASNSPIAYVRRVVDIIAVTGYFKCIVAADEVPHPKPAPDVYLQAARCLGLPPAECLAFEDTTTGAGAALVAGMRCVFIPNPDSWASDPPGVDAVFPSLSAFHAALDEWLAPAPPPGGERDA